MSVLWKEKAEDYSEGNHYEYCAKALTDYNFINPAFVWANTKQGQRFWHDFYIGGRQEEGKAILIQYLKEEGQNHFLPEQHRITLTEQHYEEMI